MAIKDLPIKKFWQKLMVSSQSVNKIPEEYLKLAQNARIFDGGIWPARGKKQLTSSTIWTNNKWGFVLNDILYQITNWNIYSIDEDTGAQTLIVALWYDARTDILPYWNDFAIIVSEWEDLKVFDWTATLITPTTIPNTDLWEVTITIATPAVFTLTNHWLSEWDMVRITTTWALPTGLSINTSYFVISTWLTADNFQLSETLWWVAIDTSWAQSWTHNILLVNTWWIIEFINSNQGYTLYGVWNILYISRPIIPTNPEYAYDFVNSTAQNIDLKSKIVSIRVGISWVFIFTEDWRVTFIWTDSLQDIAWSPTFLSRTLGIWGVPVSNRSVTASWDQIFYLTKNKIWNTINYIGWTDKTTIWKLSSIPVIWIDELLQWIASNQPSAESFYNENDNTIQMHVRTNTAWFNDITLIYDMINITFAIDKGKNYNYMVKKWEKYYWFSDINSSVYEDDTGTSMAWSPIPFKIVSQAMNQWTIKEKRYWGFFTAWVIWPFTKLDYIVKIDWGWVFSDSVEWESVAVSWLWEIWWDAIWDSPLWWELNYTTQKQPFDRYADEGRIVQYWTRIEVEIRSTSLIQDFLVDILWVRAEQSNHIDISSKF